MAALPSVELLMSSVMKCRQQKDLVYAKHFHVQICSYGLDAHDILGNYIVPMLVDCGSISDAERIFNRLTCQTVQSWTSLISGYIQCGQSHLGFDLYQKMQLGIVNPSSYTFVALLKECASTKDVERGHAIHKEITQKGFEIDVFVGSTLVGMYTKIGLLPESHLAFNQLPVRDAVIWNVLIAGYAEHGPAQEALKCFAQMKAEDICPTTATYSSSLKACCNMEDAENGQALHTEITQRGLETDLVVGNTLIDMYAKFGSLLDAQKVFDSLLFRDCISFNALMVGYAEHGPCSDAIRCYQQMLSEGILGDEVTVVCYLKICGSLGVVDKGRELDREISRKGYAIDNFVSNTLVGMYAKCGSLSRARELFDLMAIKDVVSWNALIIGYAEHGYDEEALECFGRMKVGAVCQDPITFVCALKACGNTRVIGEGRRMHLETVQKGFERDLSVGSSLVEMYAKCCSLWEARWVFDRLPSRDIKCWNALVLGYAEHGPDAEVLMCLEQMQQEEVSPDNVTFSCGLKGYGGLGATDKGKEIYARVTKQGFERDIFVGSALVDMYTRSGCLVDAQAVFDMLPTWDDALWNALISGYVEHGPCQVALECFERMQRDGFLPDAVTYVCILKGCGVLGAIEKGQEVHIEITQRGIINESYAGNALIHMYTKCGLLSEAHEVFETLSVKDVTSWNAIIKGYGINHEGCMAVQCFENMQEQGVRPDVVTFACLLTACARANLIVKGQEFFRMMKEDYGLVPSNDHFNCMVDLFARTGHLYEAQKFLETMPSSPSKVLWTVLLSGCEIHKDPELGNKCFEQLVEMNQGSLGPSENICANAAVCNNFSRIEELLELSEVPNSFTNAMIVLGKKLQICAS